MRNDFTESVSHSVIGNAAMGIPLFQAWAPGLGPQDMFTQNNVSPKGAVECGSS